MLRAVVMVLFAATLMLLAATGCQRSTETTDPKVQVKDKQPIQPVQPGGVPGTKGAKTGPAPGSQ
jgi:energy-converting hydrogenase Eha subunit F